MHVCTCARVHTRMHTYQSNDNVCVSPNTTLLNTVMYGWL